MVIKDKSALEACVNEHAAASGEENASKFALQEDTQYCAGMLVQVNLYIYISTVRGC
jgi:hypothetical protein